jgi:threonine synthase
MADTGGSAVAVSDDEVVEGIRLLAESEGVFAETAGGVVVSGLRRLVEAGRVGRDELVVAFITGSGLKTQEAVWGRLREPLRIEATVGAFEQALGQREEALPAG